MYCNGELVGALAHSGIVLSIIVLLLDVNDVALLL